MPETNSSYLKTGLSQIETNRHILERLHSTLNYLTYNVKRYKIPVTLVLFYSEQTISKAIEKSIRLTDVLITIKLSKSHFNFIFLPFTESLDSYTLIKHIQKESLSNIKHFYYFDELEANEFNYYNFLNSYLFKITEKIESDALTK